MRPAKILAAALLLAACASSPERVAVPAAATQQSPAVGSPDMVAADRPLQCVTHARALSGLPIRGDAWTWWSAAEGRYQRGPTPRVGSVLVLKRTDRLRRGHLAVVTRVLGPREVLAEHANWLNRGRIHRNVPLVDVSPANDWSQVRLWYVPGNHLGTRIYPAHGFIHAVALTASLD